MTAFWLKVLATQHCMMSQGAVYISSMMKHAKLSGNAKVTLLLTAIGLTTTGGGFLNSFGTKG
jgi:hypothetical protein